MRPPTSWSLLPERSSPKSRTTPSMPTTIPTAAQPCERSSWSKPSASSAVKIGAAETRMPASWDSMWFSPKVMSRNGMTTCTKPDRRHPRPAPAQRRERVPAPGQRQQDDGAQRGADADDGALAEVVERDLDEHVRGAPHRGGPAHHQPGAARHRHRASQPASHQRQQTSLGQDISCADASTLASR